MLTKVCVVSATSPEEEVIELGAKALQEGKLVVFPTETVYGIAANALDSRAVSRVYAIKKRPIDKPLSWHVASVDQVIAEVGELSENVVSFLNHYWPGPVTVVLETKKGGSCGFRMPDHPVALALIKQSNVPVLAPSANLSGKAPPVTLVDALRDLDGKVDLALDAGKTTLQKESTVIDLTQKKPIILREGALSKSKIDSWFAEHS